jgi:hypothetical protein
LPERSLDLRSTSDSDSDTAKESTDIAPIPDCLALDPNDAITPQSDILKEIIANSLTDASNEDKFVQTRRRSLKLSKLRALYEDEDDNVLSLLGTRHRIKIDEEYMLKMGVGKIHMDTTSSMIDFHVTVGGCLGLSPLLPNARSDHQFCLYMDLHQPYKDFKGKNALLGFDPTGRMLYLGRCRNEEVFLAMAPNQFLKGHFTPTRAGYSKGLSVMSTRHYRQMIMMLAEFLAKVSELSFFNAGEVHEQSLDSASPDFVQITDIM